MGEQRTIGIIAGNGIYPGTFVAGARREEPETRLAAAAFRGETEESMADKVDAIEWFRVGQLGKMIKWFRSEGAKEAVMVGQIAPKNLYEFRPDLRTLMMLARVRERNAETLFGAIADELAKDGIELLPATTFLEDYLAAAGVIAGPAPRKRQLSDIEYGMRIAKESSRLDIGQSVVVRHGTVLAVEAFEGTNACIRRGGELGGGKEVTLVKVSKPNQDFRFDVPVIGPETIENCAEAGVGTIAVEAGCTLVLGREDLAAACEREKISVFGVEG
jgi:DUF1009 family protein